MVESCLWRLTWPGVGLKARLRAGALQIMGLLAGRRRRLRLRSYPRHRFVRSIFLVIPSTQKSGLPFPYRFRPSRFAFGPAQARTPISLVGLQLKHQLWIHSSKMFNGEPSPSLPPAGLHVTCEYSKQCVATAPVLGNPLYSSNHQLPTCQVSGFNEVYTFTHRTSPSTS